MDERGNYATYEELLAATVYAGRPLKVTVYPPHKRERYAAMHLEGLGYTDTRRFRRGRDRRARSETYGRRMVWDYIACTYDLDPAQVRDGGPEIEFTWSPLSREALHEGDDE